MMRTVVLLCSFVAGLASAPLASAGAQGIPAQVTGPTGDSPAGNATPPVLQSERGRRLDELYSRLREAEGARQARVIELQIGVTLGQSGSDTADLLMARATQAAQGQQADLALALLDAVVDLYPDYVEAWHRRALLHMGRRDYGLAVSDIENALRLEPRHFTAMMGLGTILQQLGRDREALTVFRKALEINPHLERVPEMIRRLGPKVEGQEL